MDGVGPSGRRAAPQAVCGSRKVGASQTAEGLCRGGQGGWRGGSKESGHGQGLFTQAQMPEARLCPEDMMERHLCPWEGSSHTDCWIAVRACV